MTVLASVGLPTDGLKGGSIRGVERITDGEQLRREMGDLPPMKGRPPRHLRSSRRNGWQVAGAILLLPLYVAAWERHPW
jgi:hypothetical protein